MNMATGFDRRHPRGVVVTRVLVTALVTGAGAGANIVWAYRVYRAAMH